MATRTRVPALGAEGWFTLDEAEPALLGQRCTVCGTYAFPKAEWGCPNPACTSTDLAVVPLSRRGTIWSYTDAQYQPPPPYVVPGDDHVPFAIAAVELPAEGIVVMGQLTAGTTVDELRVGQEVELVVDVLFSDEETDHLVWKWKPVGPAAGNATTEGGQA